MGSKVRSVAEAQHKKDSYSAAVTDRLSGHLLFGFHLCQLPLPFSVKQVSFCCLGITRKGHYAMFKHSKVRQAGLIVFATTLLLILPNLTRLFG
ncbi:hypothetical protein [Pseudomonas sp.]